MLKILDLFSGLGGFSLGLERTGHFKTVAFCEIDKFCKEISIDWFASAWDLNSLNFLKKYNFKYNKIASAMIIDEKFLYAVAKQKKYTFNHNGL